MARELQERSSQQASDEVTRDRGTHPFSPSRIGLHYLFYTLDSTHNSLGEKKSLL